MPKEKQRRIMEDFEMGEISWVDTPAQTPAKMTITKRRGKEDDMGESIFKAEDVSGVLMKRWLDASQGARPFTDFLSAAEADKTYYDAVGVACDEIYALDESLRSTIGDSSLSVADKEAMMRNSVEEFMSSIRSKWPEIEQSFMKLLTEDPAETIMKGRKMSAQDEKKVADLEKQVADLTKKLEAAMAASEDVKKAAELQASVDELTKSLEEATAGLDALKAEKEQLEKAAKMSDEEKDHMSRLKEKDKDAFMNMSPDERKKAMKKSAEDDEVIKVGDREIRKSVVGEDQFAVFKAQEDRIAKQDEEIRKERGAREEAVYSKRAETEYTNLPGDTASKASVLKAIDKIENEDTRKALGAMLKAGDGAMVSAFSTIGHRGEELKKARGTFEKKVNEIMASEKLSKADAMSAARKRFPEEFKAYQGEEASGGAN